MKATFATMLIVGISIAVSMIVNPAAGVTTGSVMFAMFTRDNE